MAHQLMELVLFVTEIVRLVQQQERIAARYVIKDSSWIILHQSQILVNQLVALHSMEIKPIF